MWSARRTTAGAQRGRAAAPGRSAGSGWAGLTGKLVGEPAGMGARGLRAEGTAREKAHEEGVCGFLRRSRDIRVPGADEKGESDGRPGDRKVRESGPRVPFGPLTSIFLLREMGTHLWAHMI